MSEPIVGLENRVYIGDSVYVGMEDRTVVLYTYNGVEVSNTIYLEESVLEAFITWLEAIRKTL
jgi:hypothetical protein